MDGRVAGDAVSSSSVMELEPRTSLHTHTCIQYEHAKASKPRRLALDHKSAAQAGLGPIDSIPRTAEAVDELRVGAARAEPRAHDDDEGGGGGLLEHAEGAASCALIVVVVVVGWVR